MFYVNERLLYSESLTSAKAAIRQTQNIETHSKIVSFWGRKMLLFSSKRTVSVRRLGRSQGAVNDKCYSIGSVLTSDLMSMFGTTWAVSSSNISALSSLALIFFRLGAPNLCSWITFSRISRFRFRVAFTSELEFSVRLRKFPTYS